MPERASVTQVSQLGKETTEATAVAALKRLTGLSIELAANINFSRFRPAGYRRPTLSVPGKKWTGINASGKANYNELPYILSSVYRTVTPTTPGGGTNAREWTYNQSSSEVHNVETYTLEKGSKEGCERCAGAFFGGWGMTGDSDTVDITAEGMGRKISVAQQLSTNEVQTLTTTGGPTGGTITITYSGQTTATIAYNASASTIQTALEALSNIEAGDVLCAGGPLNTTPVTIEFRGNLGHQNVTQVTVDSTGLTGGTTPTVTPTTTTPGVAASEISLRPVVPEHIKWYADSASGSIGSTLLTRVLSWSISDTGMRDMLFTVNRDNAGSPAAKVDLEEPSGQITLMLEADTAGMAFYTLAEEGSEYFLRFEAFDDTDSIESGQRYECVLDFAVRVSAIGAFSNDQGVYAIEFTFDIMHSAAWTKATSFRVKNALTAL